jgi:hypothetical protein
MTGHPTRTGVIAPEATDAALDRAALAQSVLRRVEQRTGARRWSGPAVGARAARALSTPRPAPVGPAVRPVVDLVQERPALPVPGSVAHLLPDGLSRGTTVVVEGSTSLLLTLVAEASRAGSWVALVGLPRVGLLAADEIGVVLARLALVPHPGPEAPTVVAALIDGMDVVVLGEDVGLTSADRRRLMARARERGSVLVSTVRWPGAQLVLTAEQQQWSGLGTGDGRLHDQRLMVCRTGRGQAAATLRREVVLPGAAVLSGERRSGSLRPGRTDTPDPLRLVG